MRFFRKDLWGIFFVFFFFLVKILRDHGGVLEGDERKVVRMRFVDLYFEGSTKTICYAMYYKRQSIYLKIGYDG